ncbi:hypothetical protein Tco_0487508 [Tanacetum coccineum]
MIQLRAEAPSTSYSLLLPPPIILSQTRLDAPSSGTPPLLPIPLPTSSPPLHLLYTDRESSSAPTTRPHGGFRADYGFVVTMDREIMRDLERDGKDTDQIYTRLDDEQTERQLMAGRLNMLYRDRRAHARTARLIEAEAKMYREAWG